MRSAIMVLWVVIINFLIAGCASNQVWFKEGSSNSDFDTANFNCLQQSQQQAGTAYVNQYGGAAQQGQVTNVYLYNSCMGSKGWRLEDKHVLDQKYSQPDEKKIEINELNEKIKAMCTKSEYSELFLKTPCKGVDISFANITDNTKITQEQKKSLAAWRSETEINFRNKNNFLLINGSDKDKKVVSYFDSIQNEIDAYNLDLYNGKITWGEYNKRRKDMTTKSNSEIKRIYQ